MRRFLWSFILLAATVLAACSPTKTAAPAPATQALKVATATAPQPAAVKSTQPASPTLDPNATTMECQVVSLAPTPGPTETSMFPPLQESDWVRGSNSSAPLTIIEYSDFQCPYCALLATDLETFIKKYPNDIRIAFRHFPLPSHPLAKKGALAAEAAGLQGKFWEMHDVIFASQQTTNSMDEQQFNDWLVQQAQSLGLDKDRFAKDMTSQAMIDKIDADQKHGIDIGIPGTPMVLLNGQPYQGPRDVGSFEAILNLFKLQEKQFTTCPAMVIDPKKQYTAVLKTEKGEVTLQLYPDKAPLTVNSFVFLVKQGWFNNVTFHRVLPGFVAQTGDPSGSGMGGPGYYFRDEISDLKFDKAGVVGMANAGANSNGSQFFITYQATPDLDGKYTIFGQVIEGMDVLEKLTARDPSQQMGLPPGDKILSVEIKEK